MTAPKKRKPSHIYEVDVDFYSVSYLIKAKSAGEARKKARAKIRKGVALKNVNHMYVDKL
jgi:hypothetical protein